ncbi:dolichyl-phosphate beta-glucosyltransferase [Singulisphaera sp. GP187]|uniref:dolichyl-phosphate beta-glucosyltransferase n=1 Tax=Singulisphaera sp. GP187 TaxID=1882752 RepID=UPI000925F8EA|nr:dolichyl-phosphate beta-glucosyltransferase [Singulisphaera sp. GP187]SIN73612.1 dolichyl-phosphate beta-glucosyltransferase [Singulisphaera sp. GP187]
MRGRVETNRGAGREFHRSHGDGAEGGRKPHLTDRFAGVGEVLSGLSVVVPAYNEEERLGASLTRIWNYLSERFPAFELIVVDDGSTDATARVVAEFAADHHSVELIAYQPNRGKGYAVRTGILRASFDLVLFSDADLATPIEEIDALLERIRAGADVAIGSRMVAGSELKVRQPWYRELAGRSFNLLAQRMATPGIVDTQCGFKLFLGPVARDLFNRMTEDGFGFDIEVLLLALRLGYEVAEVPVEWRHCEGSKVRLLRDSARMFSTLVRVRKRHHAVRSLKNERVRV